MAYNALPTVATSDSWTASRHNTYIKDNFSAVWVGTTAGDMDYYTGATGKSRLALTVGGVMYGGASAPVWLAKPSVNSLLKNTSVGTPSWLSINQIPGVLHTKGVAFTNTQQTTYSTSYTEVSASFKIDLTLAVTCTVIAWAHGVARKEAGTYEGYFALTINSVTDPNVENVRVKTSVPTPFSTMYYATGVAAGTRTIKLLYKTENASDGTIQESCAIHAIAIPE